MLWGVSLGFTLGMALAVLRPAHALRMIGGFTGAGAIVGLLLGCLRLVPVGSIGAAEWTKERAMVAAFRSVQNRIDLAQYPASDPDHQENIAALGNGRKQAYVNGRFITAGEHEYSVSHINEYRLPRETLLYAKDGQTQAVRIFSSPQFPRAAYTYCYYSCERYGKHYQPGELSSVSFHPSDTEFFYFTADGKLVSHDRS